METTELKPPKVVPKPPERNDYEVNVTLAQEVHLVDMGAQKERTLTYKNITASEMYAAVEKLTTGFIEFIDGVLHHYTKYNILHIRATKKEKCEQAVTGA